MDEQNREQNESASSDTDIKSLVRGAIQEFFKLEQSKAEPAYKTELLEERKRREQLERRLNELVEENRRSRMMTEELERHSAIKSELQRLGVAKIDLAFKAVKDEVARAEDGRLIVKSSEGEMPVREYLTQFVSENPELLPARIPGGSGVGSMSKPVAASSVDLDKIRPGMSAEERDRVRQEIARIAAQTVRGL
jgi:hypothetical protein